MTTKKPIPYFADCADLLSYSRHEINNSLTAIDGYAKLLEKKIGSQKTPEARWSRELSKGSGKLIKLVAKLLNEKNLRTSRI